MREAPQMNQVYLLIFSDELLGEKHLFIGPTRKGSVFVCVCVVFPSRNE